MVQARNNCPGFLLQVPADTGWSFKEKQFYWCSGESHKQKHSMHWRRGSRVPYQGAIQKVWGVFLSVTKNNGVIVPPEKKYMPYKLKLCSLNVGLGRIPHRYCFVIWGNFFAKVTLNESIEWDPFFCDKDFPPTVDKLELPDKMIVDFWLKEPDKIIQHQINITIKR